MRMIFVATLLAIAASASALTSTPAGGWVMGKWQCSLDSRPTRIEWRMVDVNYGRDNGDGTSTSAAAAEIRGRFWDRNGPWTTLTYVSGTRDTVRFRHADGNMWFLRAASRSQASGYSTWNSNRYPLSCTKSG